MPSLRHAAVAEVVRLSGRKKAYADRDALLTAINRRRPRESGEPPARLRSTVVITPEQVAGFPVYRVSAARGTSGSAGLYLHGGAYVFELQPQHWRFVARLVERTGVPVLVPRYPLAPEATWRDSFDRMVNLVAAQPGTPLLLGDSAGGGYAVAVARRMAAIGRPAAVVAISPWADLTFAEPPSADVADRDPWLALAGLRYAGELWSAGEPERPECSPLLGDLTGLAELLVLCGTRDLLHGQATALAARAEADGVKNTLVTAADLIHVYPLLPVPEARLAFEVIAHFVTTHTTPTPL
ncbi:alpha/beta hydrolase fold domain-containing protein [Hamadaea tsunoensis]|uniref:alpha/beta hydrolase fold domain-containing protein n=1 Tax=Hamadaea tsunoensis TaxID=53368 RepID=UPI0004899BA5|nr:alpha/beta hydrolase [Hamadaea tsunoensis]